MYVVLSLGQQKKIYINVLSFILKENMYQLNEIEYYVCMDIYLFYFLVNMQEKAIPSHKGSNSLIIKGT